MHKFFIFFILFVALFVAGFTHVHFVSAQTGSTADEINRQLGAAAGSQGANLGAPIDPRFMVANIIKVALGIVGTIFIILTIYAGFLWMTGGGNEDNISKAKKILIASVIGLAIVLSSYAITYFVTGSLLFSASNQNYNNGYGNNIYVNTGVTGYGGPGCCYPLQKTCDQMIGEGDCAKARDANPGAGIWYTTNCTSCY